MKRALSLIAALLVLIGTLPLRASTGGTATASAFTSATAPTNLTSLYNSVGNGGTDNGCKAFYVQDTDATNAVYVFVNYGLANNMHNNGGAYIPAGSGVTFTSSNGSILTVGVESATASTPQVAFGVCGN
jgi:hypothetical protein